MSKIPIQVMLQKLNEMYEREDVIIKQANLLKAEYDQLQEDKELLQYMIMHQSNKFSRIKK